MKILILLALTGSAFAQGVRYDGNVTTAATNVPPGAQAQVLTVPNALISVCYYPATGGQPCTNYAPIFSDSSMTAPIVQPLQADGQGRFTFYASSGQYAASYQKANGAFVGTYILSLPPDPRTIGGIKIADQFPGSDIGAKVNAAIASCGGTASCYVQLTANTSYALSTQIVVPDFKAVWLDCANSTIVSSVATEAVHVGFMNEDSQTGGIINCAIIRASDNAAANASGVIQDSRIWFTYDNLKIAGFHNANSVGIRWQNTGTAQWDGSGNVNGYNERNHLNRVSFSDDTIGLDLWGSQGGTNSFARVVVDAHFDMFPGQKGLYLHGGGSDVYGSNIDLRGNLSSTVSSPATLLAIGEGSEIRNSSGFVEAECGGVQGNLLNIIDANSYVKQGLQIIGSGNCTILNAGNSSNIQNLVGAQGFHLEPAPFTVFNAGQAASSMVDWTGIDFTLGFPTYGGAPLGKFAIYTAETYPIPDVSRATPHKEMFTCTPGDPGTFGGIFGCTAGLLSHAGSRRLATLQTDGFAVARQDIGTDGTQLMFAIDPDGTTRMNLHAVGTVGQPSNPFVISAYDSVALSNTNIFRLDVSNYVARVTIPGTVQVGATPAACTGVSKTGTSAGGGEISYTSGSTGVADTAQVCLKDASDSWAWRSIGGAATSLDLGYFTPSSSSATCTQGQHSFDGGFTYQCVATNSWRRNASTSF